ncbi:hypothetical protein Z042_26420 [Chania multitudinisentens RB-25]|uniref:LemA family protein n=1 Tax=Chania multitudinisentens RB-25 TaxID=1441930 RepID=A0A0D4ZXN3_9GAMM|nr:LemA family protein [Chania multitudinisentens]AJW28972.1 hypothetical protein Z042_26420 [Chania multitudinisentens RB-25]
MNSLIALVIVVALALLMMRYLIVLYNKIVALRNYVEKSFANIDVLLKQRADEIPELIKVAEKVMVHQGEVFTQLAQLRSRYLSSRQSEEKVQVANQTDELFRQIFMLAENYPELKAIHHLTALQQRISLLENSIADRQEFFNQSVMLYNIGIQVFPNIVLAKLLGYQKRSLLKYH